MENGKKTDNALSFKVSEIVFRNDIDPGDFIAYNPDKCTACGECVMVCSVNLWSIPAGEKAKLSPQYKEKCMECAACYAVCEYGAIDFRYPDGGAGIIIKHG